MLTTLIPKFKNEEDYQAFKEIAVDSYRLNETLKDYELVVSKLSGTFKSSEVAVVRDYIILQEMVKWLKAKNLENSGTNRVKYYFELNNELYKSEKK